MESRKRNVHSEKLKNTFLREILKLGTRNTFIAVYMPSANPVYLSNTKVPVFFTCQKYNEITTCDKDANASQPCTADSALP